MTFKTLFSAALMGGLLVSAPVLACPGAGAAQTAAATAPKKDVVLTGVVTQEGCPMDAAEKGCTGYVVTTAKGDKFMIVKSAQSDKLLKGLKAGSKVELKGDVLDSGDGHAMVHVVQYKVAGNA
ncbi:MAG: hypothetical protein HY904_22115 [Deltaproteobacteria bacterium]|nr:hypothetical protein [Deltaproteobacteria bacterium]